MRTQTSVCIIDITNQEQTIYPIHPVNPVRSTPDPEQGCYYETLSPEDQAIFDYQMRLETGDYKEGEIQPRPVTEASRQDYAAALKRMREVAAKEGVLLLPNPLSGTLTHPNARSP